MLGIPQWAIGVVVIEERVDFAERLLAQQREGQRLGPPQG